MKENKNKKNKKNLYNIAYYVIVCCLFIFAFCFKIGIVVGDSMVPTLRDKQFVLIDKTKKEYDRNDIVVINTDHGHIIKRIIGLPGERVEIKGGFIYINDIKLEESYDFPEITNYGLYPTITLYEDSYYVMGDNRNNSMDSRAFGGVNISNIIGVVRR